MDLSQFAGLDYQTVEIAGRPFKVGLLTLLEWAGVQAWIKANAPGPLAALRSEELDGLSKADRSEILRMAFAEAKAWPPRVASTAWFLALDAPGGHAALFLAILGKHQPGLTLDDCQRLVDGLDGPGVAVLLVCHAMGMTIDPKSPASAAGTATAATTIGRPPTTSAPSGFSSPRRSGGRRRRRSR